MEDRALTSAAVVLLLEEMSVIRVEELVREMATIVARFAEHDGEHRTPVDSLYVGRSSAPTLPLLKMQWPCLAIVLQGAKSVTVGVETHEYGVGDYVVVSLDLAVASRVTSAAPDQPHLAVGMAIRPHVLHDVMTKLPRGIMLPPSSSRLGVAVNRADGELLDAMARLVRLIEKPHQIDALAPLFEQEILYLLLQSSVGSRLFEIATAETSGNKIARAIRWLKQNYARALRIDELAELAGMSASSLHQHFKDATALSPLQFQKQLRLQEARRLMLVERLDVGSAGFAVGYQSPSQFSREYSRLHGIPPSREAALHLKPAD